MLSVGKGRIIKSLTRGEFKDKLKKYGLPALCWLFTGDFYEKLKTGSQLYTDFTARQTHGEERKAAEEFRETLPKIVELIESKEIRVVPDAFNSSAAYTAMFQSAALVAISLVVLKLNDAIEKVGSALESIRSELAIANVAKVQGWENDGFGSHVYRFVRDEMANAARHDPRGHRHHYFYAWNPDTDWYPRFEERQRERSLGPNFGGYSTDLEAICLRMISDRATLIKTKSYGRDAVFHLLIPAYGPIVISQPIAFHSALLPLVVTGQRHRGVDFVWFDLPSRPTDLTLRCVGVLDERESRIVITGLIGMISSWIGFAGCAIASTVCPPCAPVAASLMGGFAQAGVASGIFAWGAGGAYNTMYPEVVRTLGEPIFIPDASAFPHERKKRRWFLSKLKCFLLFRGGS
jgi:hypothetical protein